MYYAAIDTMAECIHTRFNQKDFKVYQSIQDLLLKAVAREDHGEELAKVMGSVQGYRHCRNGAGKMTYITSRLDIADLLDFFQLLRILVNSY